MIVFSILIVLVSAFISEATEIVGADLSYPSDCRLGQLPELSRFVNDFAPLYEALALQDGASEPVLRFVDAQRRVVLSQSVASTSAEGITDLLTEQGIMPWSPKPVYERRLIPPTARCVAWRRTSSCDPSGAREEDLDMPCTSVLPRDVSGFCECIDGRRIPLSCGRDDYVTCESRC